MFEQLRRMFVGEMLLLSHSPETLLNDAGGICVAIHQAEQGYDIELSNSHRWNFIPDKIGDNFAEGSMRFAKGRRRIEVIA